MKTTLKEFHINNKVRSKSDGVPRQPNDRDESPDGGEIEPKPDIKQAYEDLQNGLVDTDLHGMRGVDELAVPDAQQKRSQTK